MCHRIYDKYRNHKHQSDENTVCRNDNVATKYKFTWIRIIAVPFIISVLTHSNATIAVENHCNAQDEDDKSNVFDQDTMKPIEIPEGISLIALHNKIAKEVSRESITKRIIAKKGASAFGLVHSVWTRLHRLVRIISFRYARACQTSKGQVTKKGLRSCQEKCREESVAFVDFLNRKLRFLLRLSKEKKAAIRVQGSSHFAFECVPRPLPLRFIFGAKKCKCSKPKMTINVNGYLQGKFNSLFDRVFERADKAAPDSPSDKTVKDEDSEKLEKQKGDCGNTVVTEEIRQLQTRNVVVHELQTRGIRKVAKACCHFLTMSLIILTFLDSILLLVVFVFNLLLG